MQKKKKKKKKKKTSEGGLNLSDIHSIHLQNTRIFRWVQKNILISILSINDMIKN